MQAGAAELPFGREAAPRDAVAEHANREEEIRGNFYHYDADGSGTIERAELANLLADLGFDNTVIDSKFAEW